MRSRIAGNIGSASAANVGLSVLVIAVIFAVIGIVSYKVVRKQPRNM